jgi:hypothetical protein
MFDLSESLIDEIKDFESTLFSVTKLDLDLQTPLRHHCEREINMRFVPDF